jgi:hypothetical protein
MLNRIPKGIILMIFNSLHYQLHGRTVITMPVSELLTDRVMKADLGSFAISQVYCSFSLLR